MNERDPWWVWFSERCEELEKMRREVERDGYWHMWFSETFGPFEPCHVELPELPALDSEDDPYHSYSLDKYGNLDKYGKPTLHRLTHKGVKAGSEVPDTLRELVEQGGDK